MKTNIKSFAIPPGIPLGLQILEKELQVLRQKKLVITLDGNSSSGKSTLAKSLAQFLEYLHIDSGAMYRAVTLQILRQNVDVNDSDRVTDLLNQTQISFERQGQESFTILNGENVEKDIRDMKVSNKVSEVAANSVVRRFLVEQQRTFAGDQGIIMDGRDIGTVVFPDADIKFFITADKDVRAQRRYEELVRKGATITYDAVIENISERDHIDSTRKDSPLVRAEDAILLDTTGLSQSEQLQKALSIIIEKTKA